MDLACLRSDQVSLSESRGQNTLLQISLKNTKCHGTFDYFTIIVGGALLFQLMNKVNLNMSSFIFHQNKINKESLGNSS